MATLRFAFVLHGCTFQRGTFEKPMHYGGPVLGNIPLTFLILWRICVCECIPTNTCLEVVDLHNCIGVLCHCAFVKRTKWLRGKIKDLIHNQKSSVKHLLFLLISLFNSFSFMIWCYTAPGLLCATATTYHQPFPYSQVIPALSLYLRH